MLNTMQVIKRDGRKEPISFDKVKYRIENLCALPENAEKLQKVNPEKYEINKTFTPLKSVDSTIVAQKVINGIYDGVSTRELDELAMATAQPMSINHPEYGILAGRLAISNYHKNTLQYLIGHYYDKPVEQIKKHLFMYTVDAMYHNIDVHGVQTPLVAPYVYSIAKKYADRLESMIDYSRDFNYNYMGFKVLEGSYLIKANIRDGPNKRHRVLIERPQHLIMRAALGIHCSKPYESWDRQRQDYDKIWSLLEPILSKRFYPELLDHFKKKLFKNRMDWEDIIHKYKTSGPVILESDEVDRMQKIIAENTKSWDELESNIEVSEETWEVVRETYDNMSNMLMIHATPTLFHAGTLRPQCSSCYIGSIDDDLYGIAHHWKINAQIAKWAGGQATHYHNIRSTKSYIRGTNGTSNGVPPLLRVDDALSLYIDQGGNRRPGSHATYYELWHADIETILRMRDPHEGNEEEKAKHLFYGMWIADEFMRTLQEEHRRIANGEQNVKLWYLMDPNQSRFLSDCYDEKFSTHWLSDEELNPKDYKFTHLYRKYIREGKYVKQVSASETLWKLIYAMTRKTGQPYMCYKDAVNRKSNQKNIGTIKSSNLCVEIQLVSSAEEIAVCNLSSVALNKFVVDNNATMGKKYPIHLLEQKPKYKCFDFEGLMDIVRMCVRNINKIIDINYYPVPETYRSNMRHRPIGIGVQGQADMLSMLRLPFASGEALELMSNISECMYFAALDESCKLAKRDGPYETFQGSPASRGELQFDLWIQENPNALKYKLILGQEKWNKLISEIEEHGLRNSVVRADMPTGSTSNIMGNSPCFEPHNGLIYKRRNKAGEFIITNKYFQQDMLALGLWNDELVAEILASRTGGIGHITSIPKQIRDIYPTVWELRPADPMRHALVAGPFTCQSRSMSLFVQDLSLAKFTKLQFFAWRRGLKTGSYYTRQQAGLDARKVETVKRTPKATPQVCSMEEGCLSCGS